MTIERDPKFRTETYIAPNPCPVCGRPNDRLTNPDRSGPPEPGDITVCIGCYSVLEFGEGLTLSAIPVSDLPPADRTHVEQFREALRLTHGAKH